MNSAELSCTIRILGLSTTDLAELGGVSGRHARRWLTDDTPVPGRVVNALQALRHEAQALTSSMIADIVDGGSVLLTYETNEKIRAARPDIAGRGKAAGAFAGVHQIAVLMAMDWVKRNSEVEIEIRFSND